MKLKSQLVLVAGCIAAAPAFALSPPPLGPTPFETLFISGSSAATPIIEAAQDALCVAGTIDEFRGVAAVPASVADYNNSDQNYTGYYCTYKSAAPVPAALQGKNILVKKRSAGGSIFGVNPVATSTAVGSMVITSNAANCNNVATGKWACLETAASLVNEVPQAGVSDVEPALLQITANNPGTFPALTPAQISSALNVAFPFAQGFGIAVSADVTAAGTTNLSKSQITALLSGSYSDWSEVNPNLAGPVTVCYRTAGSGTRAGAGAFFLDIGCKPSGAQNLTAAAILNSSTGTVRGCLNTHTGAIGIVGLGDGPNAPPTTNDTWSFVSIDGYAPTQANFGKGNYQDYVESAMTVRKTGVTANQTAIFNVLKTELSDFNVIKTLATVTGNARLTDAILALDPTTLGGVAPTASGSGYAFNAAFPISWASKGNNTCQQPSVAYP